MAVEEQRRAFDETLSARLERIAPAGADVRGLGPPRAFERPERRPEGAAAVAAAEQGLALLTCGPDGDVVRLRMPLVISDDELDRGLSILERALGSRGNIEG